MPCKQWPHHGKDDGERKRKNQVHRTIYNPVSTTLVIVSTNLVDTIGWIGNDNTFRSNRSPLGDPWYAHTHFLSRSAVLFSLYLIICVFSLSACGILCICYFLEQQMRNNVIDMVLLPLFSQPSLDFADLCYFLRFACLVSILTTFPL